MRAWQSGAEFKQILLEDPEVLQHLTREEVEAAFDASRSVRWADVIIDRVFL